MSYDEVRDPCPHEIIWTHQLMVIVGEPKARWVQIKMCSDCRTWFGIGHSDETPVAVEVLAAVLANPGGFVSVAHKDHHDQEWIDQDFGYAFREDCDGCQGEYLALVIATHGEE